MALPVQEAMKRSATIAPVAHCTTQTRKYGMVFLLRFRTPGENMMPYEFQQFTEAPRSGINTHVVRYADVKLMLAECYIEQNSKTNGSW